MSDPDRQSALRVLRRRWRWLVIGVVGGLLLDLLVTAALPRRYEAMTTFVLPESLPVGIDIEEVGTHFTSETLRQAIDRVGHERLDPERTRSAESLLDEIRRSLTIRFETSPTEPDQPAPSAVTLRFDGERAAVRPIPFTGGCGTSFVVSFSGFNPFPTKEVTQPPPTMITLHLEGEQPELLPDLAGEISRLFRSEIRNGISGSADKVVRFLETVLRGVEQDLNVQEQRIRNTRRGDDLPGGFPSGTAELGRLNDALRSNLEAQEHSSGRIAALLRTRGVEAAPSRGGAESSPATQRQLMIEAGEIYAELTDALDKLREEEGDLRTRIVVGRALDASPTNQNLIELTRRYEALQTTHRLILRTLEGASRASEFQSESVAKPLEVVRPTMTRRMKIWPDPLILAPSSIALGVSDALLFILWAEMRAPKRPRTDTHF